MGVDLRPRRSRQVRTEPRFELAGDSGTIAHLVCCRDISWRIAFCGAQETTIDPNATVICSMCLEEAETRRPGTTLSIPPICPVDGNPCPTDAEIDALIDERTRPPDA